MPINVKLISGGFPLSQNATSIQELIKLVGARKIVESCFHPIAGFCLHTSTLVN